MIFVGSKERTMRTELCAVTNAYNLYFFLVFFAKLLFRVTYTAARDSITRRLLISAAIIGGVCLLPQHLCKADILWKVFKIYIRDPLFMATILAADYC